MTPARLSWVCGDRVRFEWQHRDVVRETWLPDVREWIWVYTSPVTRRRGLLLQFALGC